MSTPPAAIKTFGLSKSFGDVRALNDLNLEVFHGEVFGFLGPNGSGKTTTIRLLLDFILPTAGRAELLGMDTRKHAFDLRRQVGNLPGDFFIYPQLTAEAFLRLCSGGRPEGIARARSLAERFGLNLTRKIGTLSTGNRQKAGLIQALMHDPELVILDEPTSGLDPLVKEEFYRLVDEEKARGKTIFLSSHILPEIERICDRVGIVREGKLIAVEEVASLKRHKRRRMEVSFESPVDVSTIDWRSIEGVEVQESALDPIRNSIELSIPEGSVGGVLKLLADLPVADLVFPEATLEEAFMSLYKGTTEPETAVHQPDEVLVMKIALIGVELRLSMYGILAWAGGLVLYAAAIVWIYPTVSEVAGMGEYLEAMPEQFRELAGVTDLTQALDAQGFFTFEGFLSTEYMGWFPVLLGIYAIISGVGIVAKDAERGTLDIILAQPIHRYGLLLTRAITQIAVLGALASMSFIALLVGALLLGEPIGKMNLFYTHAIGFGLIVSLFSFAALWSAVFLKTSRAMAVAGLSTVLLYVINVLPPSLGPLGWLEKISPFAYYESLPLLSAGDVNPASIIVYAGITVIALGIATRVFEQRDLVN